MNKKEWIVYFESVHGRKPNSTEINRAIKEGTIISGKLKSSNNFFKNKRIIAAGVVALGFGFAFFISQLAQNDNGVDFDSSVVKTSFSKKSDTVESYDESMSDSDSSSTSEPASAPKLGQMDIDQIVQGDFTSVDGTWRIPNGQGLATSFRLQNGQYSPDNSSKQVPISDVAKMDGNYARGTYQVINSGVPQQQNLGYMYFFPAGVSVSGKGTGDESKDRIILGGNGDDWTANSNTVYYSDPTSSEQEVRQQIDVAINKYRKDINQSLATRQDHIASNFTSTSNPSYIETRDYVVNQSAADKVKSYTSVTNSIENLVIEGDVARFTLHFTTTTAFTDGSVSAPQANNRNYIMKKIDGVYKIESF